MAARRPPAARSVISRVVEQVKETPGIGGSGSGMMPGGSRREDDDMIGGGGRTGGDDNEEF
jgi:hypothetical protein